MAARTGDVDDDELESMDRATLMDIVVKGMLAKKETDKGAIARRTTELSLIHISEPTRPY